MLLIYLYIIYLHNIYLIKHSKPTRRNSYVSELFHLGVSTKVIASLIGDTEEQVIKTYGHLYSDATDGAINLLNQALKSPKNS